MAKYSYTYTGEEARDFPTLGKRGVKKGDIVESDFKLNNTYLTENVAQTAPAQDTTDTATTIQP